MKTIGIKKTAILLIALTFLLSSCEDEIIGIRGSGPTTTNNVEISAITGVHSEISGNIYITQGSVKQVEVKAQQNIFENIQFSVKNEILYIEFDKRVKSHSSIDIYINMEELTEVNLSGSGKIQTFSNFTGANNLNLDLSGSGEILINADADFAESNLSGSGSINLSGTFDECEGTLTGSGNIKYSGLSGTIYLDLTGSGEINAQYLSTKGATTIISGSGKIKVNASETLKAQITGSGDIYYLGSPTIQSEITGSGKLKQI